MLRTWLVSTAERLESDLLLVMKMTLAALMRKVGSQEDDKTHLEWKHWQGKAKFPDGGRILLLSPPSTISTFFRLLSLPTFPGNESILNSKHFQVVLSGPSVIFKWFSSDRNESLQIWDQNMF